MLAVAMLLAPLVPALVLQPFVRPTSTLRRPSTRAASCLPAMAAIADETQVKEMRWVTGSGRVEPWATVIENIVEDCRHAAPAQARTAVDQCRLARLCPSTLCARATAPVPSLLPQAQKGRAGARGVRLGHPAGKAHRISDRCVRHTAGQRRAILLQPAL